MNNPKCAVRGMVSRGAMCGSVIVGGVYCGHKGECPHKAELPVLPGPYFGSGRYLGAAGSRDAYTTTQIQTYGAACAAQARELALEEAAHIAHNCIDPAPIIRNLMKREK